MMHFGNVDIGRARVQADLDFEPYRELGSNSGDQRNKAQKPSDTARYHAATIRLEFEVDEGNWKKRRNESHSDIEQDIRKSSALGSV